MCMDVHMGMCIGMCIDMCMDMYMDMCMHMCMDMCTDMCTDMCMDIVRYAGSHCGRLSAVATPRHTIPFSMCGCQSQQLYSESTTYRCSN